MKVAIVGSGASGMVAASIVSLKHEVYLLDGEEKQGKKILLTGNGKCNYWNEDITLDKYNTDDFEKLENIISEENQEEVLSFLENIGLFPKIKNGYYYPFSGQASSVRELLIRNLEKNNIKILTGFKVKFIEKQGNVYKIKSETEELVVDKIILAAGSCVLGKTGSDGSGYTLAKSLGHKINEVSPSLVSLFTLEKDLKDASGVRCDATLTLLINGQEIEKEQGELQITDFGISGICTFNVSGKASRALQENKNVQVNINFLPYLEENFSVWFEKRSTKLKDFTLEELLESVIPYKLMFVILNKAKCRKDDIWENLSDEKKCLLEKYLTNFPVTITNTNTFEKSQVATGGVSLSEINEDTMESKISEGLYIVGELLDVDGKCGGFNLAFAFISGYLAGRSV